MKDYYYILGVAKDATDQEIRTAYLKLSKLFHPDIHGGDAFFEERFKEIQEAYQAINNNAKRIQYEQQTKADQSINSHNAPNMSKPTISVFDVSKKAIYEGELLTISWHVMNADMVHIDPLGLVDAQGTKTIRLPNLKGKAGVTIKIIGTNSYVQKSTEKQVQVQNKSFRGRPTQLLNENMYAQDDDDDDEVPVAKAEPIKKTTTSVSTNKQPKTPAAPKFGRKDIYAYLLIAALMFIMTILTFVVYQLNGK